jgi:hypothetical protein
MTCWEDFKKQNKPLEACKAIMRDYIELGNFTELQKRYHVSHTTLRNFLDRNYRLFDREAKKLNTKMENISRANRSKNANKVREKMLSNKEITPYKNKLSTVEKNHLSILDNLPKVIRYSKFLDIISKQDIYTLSTNDWLRAAESRGIKVVG